MIVDTHGDAVQAAGGYGPPGGGGYGGPPGGGGGGYGGPPPGGGGYGAPPPPPGGGGFGGPPGAPPGGGFGQPPGGYGAPPPGGGFGGPPQGYGPPGFGPPGGGMMPGAGGPVFHPLATTALVLGIVSLVVSTLCCCFGGFGIPVPIAAIIVGVLGLGKVRANPAAYKGDVFCYVGIAGGAVGVILHLLALFSTIDDSLKSQYGHL